MLMISSNAGAGEASVPQGPVRLIQRLPMVTSVVIWSEHTGAGDFALRSASRATSCRNCLEVSSVCSRFIS